MTSSDHSRASYDNLLNYSPSSSNGNDSIYAKFDFNVRQTSLSNPDQHFVERCANYDNLSYLIPDGISSKKALLKDRKIGERVASCKDYFAATTGFIFHSNEQGKR